MQFTCSGLAQARGMALTDRRIPDEIAGTYLHVVMKLISFCWPLPYSMKDEESNIAR